MATWRWFSIAMQRELFPMTLEIKLKELLRQFSWFGHNTFQLVIPTNLSSENRLIAVGLKMHGSSKI
jgi:hypothetical protein